MKGKRADGTGGEEGQGAKRKPALLLEVQHRSTAPS